MQDTFYLFILIFCGILLASYIMYKLLFDDKNASYINKIKIILLNTISVFLGIAWYLFCLFLSALPVVFIVLIVLYFLDII